MKKIFLLLSFSFFFFSVSNAQSSQEKAVAAAAEEFKNAILNADRGALERLLSDQLVFAHSGGKIQNKSECIEEIVSLVPNDYTKIDISNQIIRVSGNAAIVHHIYAADFISNGQPGSLRIGVMLLWHKTKGRWQLLGRQAFRIS